MVRIKWHFENLGLDQTPVGKARISIEVAENNGPFLWQMDVEGESTVSFAMTNKSSCDVWQILSGPLTNAIENPVAEGDVTTLASKGWPAGSVHVSLIAMDPALDHSFPFFTYAFSMASINTTFRLDRVASSILFRNIDGFLKANK